MNEPTTLEQPMNENTIAEFQNLRQQATPLIQRLQNTTPKPPTPTDIDTFIQQILTPLFEKRGVPLATDKTDTGWLLTITYPDADSTT